MSVHILNFGTHVISTCTSTMTRPVSLSSAAIPTSLVLRTHVALNPGRRDKARRISVLIHDANGGTRTKRVRSRERSVAPRTDDINDHTRLVPLLPHRALSPYRSEPGNFIGGDLRCRGPDSTSTQSLCTLPVDVVVPSVYHLSSTIMYPPM